MATFLLVHGAWHGAWCWERVASLLREAGQEVLAIDLPAHGDDPTPPWRVSLARCSRAVRDARASLCESPILVGHSMGGLVISQAATDDPAAWAGLIYLAAFVPLRGESLLDLGRADPSSRVLAGVRPSWGGARMRPDRAREIFYQRCSEADAARAIGRLRVAPLRPLAAGLAGEIPSQLPRAFIECTEDRAISLERQRFMAARGRMDAVRSLETDHSPFLSAPAALVARLLELAAILEAVS